MKKFYLLSLFVIFFLSSAIGQISLTGSPYTQDFNTLSNTAGSTTNVLAIPGWLLTETGGGARDNEQYAVDNGASTTGDTYSYGTTATTERALGGLRSGTLIPVFGASFINNTGATITSITIAYTGEEWRLGTAARTDQINFEYSTTATDLATGTWTGVPALNFVTPNTATTGAKDGNAAANRTAITSTITGLSIPNGATFFIRWTDTDATGADDGLTVDDFSISTVGAAANNIAVAAGANAAEPATDGSFAINFSPATAATVTFDYALTGSGTFNTDYSVTLSAGATPTPLVAATGTITVPSSVSSVVVTITPIDDAALEGTETVILTLSNPSAGNTITAPSATINMTDDETPNSVSVASGLNGGEPSTNGTFTLSLSAPAPVGGVTVTYSFTGTAVLNTDYTDALSGSITIPQGQSTATIPVAAINDQLQESDETIIVTLNTASASYIIGTASATINLTDDGDIDAIPYTGVTYTQNFNTLGTSGLSTNSPSGWGIFETGTNANFSYAASDGTANSGNTYSFGTGTNAERAYGGLRSGSLVPLFGGKFINNTGSTISSLTITYTGEQWRSGTASRVDKLDFQYSTDATSLSTGTWTDVDALDFTSVNNAATGPLDGNLAGNRAVKTFALNGLSIPAGSLFFFRWQDFDASGADDGLGIDDFSVSPGCTPPTNQPTGLTLTPALTSISGSFTAAAAGTTPADAYLVVMSTSPSLGASPSSGTVYAIDDAIGNGQVISISNSLTFNATGLNPATTYYFFVFSNSSATSCYNITLPLTGSISTLSPPVCTPPATQASNLTVSNVTGTSLDLNYTRGNGDNILIVARTGGPVNSNPINSISYTAGNQIGTNNFVIYNGPASTFSYTGLTPNTTYYFALYEYNSADFCYNTSALTGNFTTACVNPVNVSSLNTTPGNTTVNVTWTLPSASCYDEIIVVASDASVPGGGGSYLNPANPVYAGPNQVVFRGVGSSVLVTGLTNGINYFFKVFTRLGGVYSSGVQVTGVPFDPASGYQYMYGNLHGHSSYSDGNKDNTTKIPADDYAFARDALCMDFLGISEHNHAGAGMALSNYPLGFAQANAINGVTGGVSGNSIVTLWGMEWGVISGGGHVITYGFDDQLVGWEAGNYNIFCAKNDYTSLFGLINGQTDAFATLAHPNSADYGNIAGTAYDATKDNAIAGVAVESGPAFSTSTTYNDFPSSLAYLGYYKTMLAKGYHLGPTMDQDNHNLTFGTANSNRLVVLTTSKTRAEVVNAIRSMRFYASQDCNVRIDYKLNSFVMGSLVTNSGVPSITLSVTDIDGENASSIELWGGQVGSSVPAGPIKTFAAVNSITFNSGNVENTQANLTTYYYFAIITQDDGNKIVTAPIWYTRSDITLPVTLTDFTAKYNNADNSVLVKWTTAQEINSRIFEIQRSNDGGINYTTIGTVSAAGNSNSLLKYEFPDFHPQKGRNIYRLKQVDTDNRFNYSKIAVVTLQSDESNYFSVSPNPVSSGGFTYVYAALNTVAAATIQVVDINGRILKTMTANLTANTPVKLDLGTIRAGVYLVRITAGEDVSSRKIIVQ